MYHWSPAGSYTIRPVTLRNTRHDEHNIYRFLVNTHFVYTVISNRTHRCFYGYFKAPREAVVMVLEGLLVSVLNHFLRPYVKNLDTSQLKVAIWSGESGG